MSLKAWMFPDISRPTSNPSFIPSFFCFYRPWRYLGSSSAAVIWIDDIRIPPIASGTYRSLLADSGVKEIAINGAKVLTGFKAASGRHYFIRIELDGNQSVAETVQYETVRKELSYCRKLP